MRTMEHTLECISPCFCAGAYPEEQAEIRAASIRGQLRWWFRALGGFCSLGSIPLITQEKHVFGSAGTGNQFASQIGVRIKHLEPNSASGNPPTNIDVLGASPGSDRGYLLFPLQTSVTNKKVRSMISGPPWPRFRLEITWRGEEALWDSIQALITVFIHLGSIGFRSRRGMGAIACAEDPPSLAAALKHFSAAGSMQIKMMPATDSGNCISVLARWLRKWRSFGRTAGKQFNSFRPGFQFAQKDHDAGLRRYQGPTYRPAIGLPISQCYSNHSTVEWSQRWNSNKHHGEGRFASPILLRPYRQRNNKWIALVIFVDTKQWPTGAKVYIDGLSKTVSLDLYNAMKEDPSLQNFLI